MGVLLRQEPLRRASDGFALVDGGLAIRHNECGRWVAFRPDELRDGDAEVLWCPYCECSSPVKGERNREKIRELLGAA